MNTITTKDGRQVYFKDWGAGERIVGANPTIDGGFAA